MRKVVRSVVVLSGVTLISQFPASALQNVMLTWSPSTNADVAGYNVYFGTASHIYTITNSVGNVTNATINGLTEGATYYFSATSYDSNTNQSALSVETSYSVPAIVIPPVTNPPATNVVIKVVNPGPTLNALSDLTLDVDAANQSVVLAGISSGTTNAKPKIKITAVSSNPALVRPAVKYSSPLTSGMLTFRPAVNGTGSATITVTVNNGTAANNVTTQSFTVTVTNAPPTIDSIAGDSTTIHCDAAFQVFPLSGITSGSPTENQRLTVTATSSNPGLIRPEISYANPFTTGWLSFKPTAHQTGSATITVTVNDGCTVTHTSMTVQVTNAAPTIDSIANVSLAENAPQQTMSLTGISSGSVSEEQKLTVTAVSSNPQLVKPSVKYSSPQATGALTIKPEAKHTGTALITVTVNDGNLTTETSFSVTVGQNSIANTLAQPDTQPVIQVPVLTTLGMVNGEFEVQVTGAPGTYNVQASSDLSNWTTIQSASIASGSTSTTFADQNAASFSQRFYRVALINN